MKGIKIYPKLTKEYIINTIGQERIMEKYIKVPVKDEYFLGSSFCNPFRKDNNPTCNYYYDNNNKLRIRDFAGDLLDRLYNMDVFDIVGHIHNLDSNVPQHFKLIQHIIAKDFRINKYEDDESEVLKLDEFLDIQKSKKKRVKIIKVVPRKWNKADELYWFKRYGISLTTLKAYRVYPAEEVWVETKPGILTRVYQYTSSNPAYAYYGGKDIELHIWKIYFPLSKGTKYNKIITNKQFEQGLDVYLPTKVGVVTKSLKDVMVLHELGIQAVTIAAESISLSADTYFKMKSYSGFIVSLLDYDTAGIKMANKLKRTYNIQPLMLTRGRYGKPDYGVKDISDFREVYGRDNTMQLINQSLDYLSDRFEDLDKQREELKWLL